MFEGVNNGMNAASEVFRGADYYGEVELQRIYRSLIAERAELMTLRK
jgi:predicted ribonuclease YlaK